MNRFPENGRATWKKYLLLSCFGYLLRTPIIFRFRRLFRIEIGKFFRDVAFSSLAHR